MLNILYQGSRQLLEEHVCHSFKDAEGELAPWAPGGSLSPCVPQSSFFPQSQPGSLALYLFVLHLPAGTSIASGPKKKKLLIPTQLLLSTLLAERPWGIVDSPTLLLGMRQGQELILVAALSSGLLGFKMYCI